MTDNPALSTPARATAARAGDPLRAPLKPDSVQHWWDELERLGRLLGQVGPEEVCCEGLSQRQCAILRVLSAQEGAKLGDLAARSGISPSAMTRVLEKLEAGKLVERIRGEHADGRAVMVRITPAGRRTRKQLDELMRQRTRAIVEALAEPEREPILRALRTLNDTMQTAGCCPLNAPVATGSPTRPLLARWGGKLAALAEKK